MTYYLSRTLGSGGFLECWKEPGARYLRWVRVGWCYSFLVTFQGSRLGPQCAICRPHLPFLPFLSFSLISFLALSNSCSQSFVCLSRTLRHALLLRAASCSWTFKSYSFSINLATRFASLSLVSWVTSAFALGSLSPRAALTDLPCLDGCATAGRLTPQCTDSEWRRSELGRNSTFAGGGPLNPEGLNCLVSIAARTDGALGSTIPSGPIDVDSRGWSRWPRIARSLCFPFTGLVLLDVWALAETKKPLIHVSLRFLFIGKNNFKKLVIRLDVICKLCRLSWLE